MKSKICIGSGVLFFLAGAFVYPAFWLKTAGVCLIAAGAFGLLAQSSGVEYTESHYRIYQRILFWRLGEWKSIGGVRRIYIRCVGEKNKIDYRVYFVRKSGNYKIFESSTLKEAREKAAELAVKYNLTVDEKAQ